jgi:glycosyltransferase involved in cell wall biosynthesis
MTLPTASSVARVAAEAASPGLDAGARPQVSVVVSTRDRGPFLAGLLAALEAQTVDARHFEVIVVDDGSTDDTWPVLAKAAATTGHRVLALQLEASVGQGPGRNAALARARGDVVAFTDDDCLPPPQWLERLTAPLRDDGSAQLVVQGRVVPTPERPADAGRWARTVWVLRPTWLFETCNIAYRRVDLEAAGGFPGRDDAPTQADGKLVGEDALLGWRVIQDGASLAFLSEAETHHRWLPAGYVDWVRSQRGRGVFPALARRSPLGRRALWRRFFLAPRTAAFDVLLAGELCAVLSGRARWLAAGLPWIALALPEARDRGRPVAFRLAQLWVGDLVGFGALVSASARERTLVL